MIFVVLSERMPQNFLIGELMNIHPDLLTHLFFSYYVSSLKFFDLYLKPQDLSIV